MRIQTCVMLIIRKSGRLGVTEHRSRTNAHEPFMNRSRTDNASVPHMR